MTDAHIYVIGILLAWMAGIRAYLTVFGVGLAGLMGWVDLPPALAPTQSWWVLGTSGALAAGAGVALVSHGLKSGTRALLNTSPEPASNWVASAAEDTVVVGGLALAIAHPWIALLLVVGASLLGALLVWWIWRTLSRGVRRLFASPPA